MGYSAFRIFEESLRVDPSQHFLGLRLNMYVAIGLTVVGAVWFYLIQRRGRRRVIAGLPTPELAAGNAQPSYQARDTDGVLTEAGTANPESGSGTEAERLDEEPAGAATGDETAKPE
jgi:hypothetical protein